MGLRYHWHIGASDGHECYPTSTTHTSNATLSHLTEQQRQPFLSSSHSSYSSPACPTARDFSTALPAWSKTHTNIAATH